MRRKEALAEEIEQMLSEAKAKDERNLICGTHNLLKLFGSLRAARN